MGHTTRAAGGTASPWEAINVTKSPSSGTPSSYLDGVVLDATGLEGWVVGDANGRMTSFSDDGSKVSIVQNAGSLGNEDWGLCNDAHYNGGTYVRYPEKIDGEFSIEVEFSISNAGAGNFCIGVAAWQEEAAVSADTPAMYSGFGRLGSTTLTNPRCHLSGLNGGTETDTDTNVSYASGATLKARLQVDSDGKCRMFFTHGGVEYEHNATSNDFKATVGGSHYVGIVTYANVSGTTFEIKSVTLTANARTETDKGEKVLYDADLASESAQDMQAGGSGDYAIGGASWTFGNMANADQMELDGSTGLVFDINSGEVDASTETAPYMEINIHDLPSYTTWGALGLFYVAIQVAGTGPSEAGHELILRVKAADNASMYSSGGYWRYFSGAQQLVGLKNNTATRTVATGVSWGSNDWFGVVAFGPVTTLHYGAGALAGPSDAAANIHSTSHWSVQGLTPIPGISDLRIRIDFGKGAATADFAGRIERIQIRQVVA